MQHKIAIINQSLKRSRDILYELAYHNAYSYYSKNRIELHLIDGTIIKAIPFDMANIHGSCYTQILSDDTLPMEMIEHIAQRSDIPFEFVNMKWSDKNESSQNNM